MDMKSMKYTAEEQAKRSGDGCCAPCGGDCPEYPYGTRVSVSDDRVTALGLEGVPVGTKVQIMAVGEIVEVSQYDTKEGKDRRVEIQIQEMGVEKAAEGPSAADVMYGSGQ